MGSGSLLDGKTVVGRCLLGRGLPGGAGSLVLSCRSCWKGANQGDHMVHAVPCWPPSAAVDVYFLVRERGVSSGVFSDASRRSLS